MDMRLWNFYFVVAGEGSMLADEVGNPEGFIVGFFAFWMDLSFSRSSSGNC